MQRRQFIVIAAAACCAPAARAHHGWSSFDQTKPLYLEGRAVKVSWRNPHVEFDLELDPQLRLPADLARRALPPQSASVDGAGLLAAAKLPARKDKVWHIELAPLTRIESWKLDEIKPGAQVGVLGYSFPGEQGNAVLRAEYIFVAGKAYGMRSSPA